MDKYDFDRPLAVIAPELLDLITITQAELAKPIVYFASAAVSIGEGNSGSKLLTITARRSTLAGTLDAPSVYVPGNANDADFPGGQPGNRTWTFPDGSDTATVDIPISGDTDFETDEAFGFRLLPGANYRLGSPIEVTGTILNNDNEIGPAVFAMTQLATPLKNYPRTTKVGGSANAGSGPIALTLNVTKGGTIYARTRSTADGNPVLQPPYLAIANAPIANGVFTINGVDARPEEFFLDLSSDGETWTLGTTPVGMGAPFGYAGQSLQVDMMVRRENVDMNTVGEAYTTLGAVYNGSWGRAGGAPPFNSAGANALIRLLATRLGCRVSLVGRAEGSTTIGQWTPGQTLHTELLTALADQADNRIEGFFWFQGHEDALQSLSAVQWASALSRITASIDAQMIDKTFPRLIATIPNVGSAYGTVRHIIGIRNAGKRWCEVNPRAISVEADDLTLFPDRLHLSQAGARRMGYHVYRSQNDSDIGPRVTGRATKAGAVITMPIDVGPGATALSVVGDPLTRMAVFTRSNEADGSRLPLASYALGPVSNGKAPLTVTLASDPGDVNLDFYFNPKLDPATDGATGVILNNAVGDGVPVGRQLTSLRPIPITYPVPLVGTNAAYSNGGAFGARGLSAGRVVPVTTRGNVVPGSSGWRMECWVNVPSASTDNTIFWFGNDRLLMVHAYDFRTNGGDLVAAGAFKQGLNHFSFSQLGPGGSVAHVNGVPFDVGPANYGDGTIVGIRGRGADGFLTGKDIVMSQVALFGRAHLRQPIDVPTAAYTGSEAGLLHLWALNETLDDTAIRA